MVMKINTLHILWYSILLVCSLFILYFFSIYFVLTVFNRQEDFDLSIDFSFTIFLFILLIGVTIFILLKLLKLIFRLING